MNRTQTRALTNRVLDTLQDGGFTIKPSRARPGDVPIEQAPLPGLMAVTSRYCLRCHRALRNPASLKAGMGPTCRGIAAAERGAQEERTTDRHDLPWDPSTGDIILQRRPDGLHTNLPLIVVHHSPSGIEWGYGGSGPADLALSIMNLYLPVRQNARRPKSWKDWLDEIDPGPSRKLHGMRYVSYEARRLYQQFKFDFVARIPKEGGVIFGAEIRAWIERHASKEVVA